MTRHLKYPSEKALDVITGPLTTELGIYHCDNDDRSKTQLFEIGGPGGRQFGLVVSDMFTSNKPKSSKQTRILLEKCELPDIAGVQPRDDDFKGSRVKQPDSRLAPSHQTSCLVADETALSNLLRWYARSGPAVLEHRAVETVDAMEQTRVEKAAEDAGFDLPSSAQGNWLIFCSTTFPQVAGVSSQSGESYRVGLSDAIIGRQIALEFRMNAVEAPEPWAARLDGVAGYQNLRRLLTRVAAVCAVVAGAGLREFEDTSQTLPNATEAIRLAVQRVGQGIFRSSLLQYWGGHCVVSGLGIAELLRASHIKPWADCSSDAERLDVFNGLLLAPHLDALFDGGWITFLSSGQIRISNELNAASRKRLGISGGEVISGLTTEHQIYLAWHREHCFR